MAKTWLKTIRNVSHEEANPASFPQSSLPSGTIASQETEKPARKPVTIPCAAAGRNKFHCLSSGPCSCQAYSAWGETSLHNQEERVHLTAVPSQQGIDLETSVHGCSVNVLFSRERKKRCLKV